MNRGTALALLVGALVAGGAMYMAFADSAPESPASAPIAAAPSTPKAVGPRSAAEPAAVPRPATPEANAPAAAGKPMIVPVAAVPPGIEERLKQMEARIADAEGRAQLANAKLEALKQAARAAQNGTDPNLPMAVMAGEAIDPDKDPTIIREEGLDAAGIMVNFNPRYDRYDPLPADIANAAPAPNINPLEKPCADCSTAQPPSN